MAGHDLLGAAVPALVRVAAHAVVETLGLAPVAVRVGAAVRLGLWVQREHAAEQRRAPLRVRDAAEHGVHEELLLVLGGRVRMPRHGRAILFVREALRGAGELRHAALQRRPARAGVQVPPHVLHQRDLHDVGGEFRRDGLAARRRGRDLAPERRHHRLALRDGAGARHRQRVHAAGLEREARRGVGIVADVERAARVAAAALQAQHGLGVLDKLPPQAGALVARLLVEEREPQRHGQDGAAGGVRAAQRLAGAEVQRIHVALHVGAEAGAADGHAAAGNGVAVAVGLLGALGLLRAVPGGAGVRRAVQAPAGAAREAHAALRGRDRRRQPRVVLARLAQRRRHRRLLVARDGALLRLFLLLCRGGDATAPARRDPALHAVGAELVQHRPRADAARRPRGDAVLHGAPGHADGEHARVLQGVGARLRDGPGRRGRGRGRGRAGGGHGDHVGVASVAAGVCAGGAR
mmetsp:Transcript_13729/g.40588  ORF Transcript_13729/g.40588 Transcript_13729/m.40588 type:complete len:465 (-) Transcript_13729:212-1606(-)